MSNNLISVRLWQQRKGEIAMELNHVKKSPDARGTNMLWQQREGDIAVEMNHDKKSSTKEEEFYDDEEEFYDDEEEFYDDEEEFYDEGEDEDDEHKIARDLKIYNENPIDDLLSSVRGQRIKAIQRNQEKLSIFPVEIWVYIINFLDFENRLEFGLASFDLRKFSCGHPMIHFYIRERAYSLKMAYEYWEGIRRITSISWYKRDSWTRYQENVERVDRSNEALAEINKKKKKFHSKIVSIFKDYLGQEYFWTRDATQIDKNVNNNGQEDDKQEDDEQEDDEQEDDEQEDDEQEDDEQEDDEQEDDEQEDDEQEDDKQDNYYDGQEDYYDDYDDYHW
jgi:hypothetical protein